MATQPPAPVPEDAEALAEQQRLAAELDDLRQQKREAEAAYRGVTTLATEMIAAFRESKQLDFTQLMEVQRDVLGLFYNFDGPLLLENMMLIRMDDHYYPYHAVNVALLNALTANTLNLDAQNIERLVKIGLVIDVGMLNLPPQLLDRNYTITSFDRVRIHQHTQASVRALAAAGEEDDVVLKAVLNHHERYNGTGYPLRLKAEQIPLEARITAISDSFDAAVAKKSYDRQKSPFEMIAELSANTHQAMDPALIKKVVAALVSMLDGCYVVLSDRSIAKVVQIDPTRLAYPQVRVLGRTIQTDEALYPLHLSAHVPLG